jgi:hypothetical protein
MGYSYYLRGEYDEAERLLREAVHLKPSDKRATSNLALVLGRRGKAEESLTLLEQVHDKPTALSSLAYIHIQCSEFELAEKCYQQALAIEPKHTEATKGLAELTKQRNSDSVVVAQDAVESNSFAASLELSAANESSSPIQQVAAQSEPSSKAVVTADFVVESSPSTPPRMLDEKNEFDDEVPAGNVSKTSLADSKFVVQAVATEDSVSQKTTAGSSQEAFGPWDQTDSTRVIRPSPTTDKATSADNAWDSDDAVPANPKKPVKKASSALPFDFDSVVNDASVAEEPGTSSTAKSKQESKPVRKTSQWKSTSSVDRNE